MRPRIIDPNFETGCATQAKEKQELASQAFNIGADPLQLTTVGGYLNVSQQAEDFIAERARTSSSNQLLARVAFAEARRSRRGRADHEQGHARGAHAADDVRQGDLRRRRARVHEHGALPEWIAMGPTGWARLGGSTDLALRPLFPFENAVERERHQLAGHVHDRRSRADGVVTPGDH
jgi:hypothetical protein